MISTTTIAHIALVFSGYSFIVALVAPIFTGEMGVLVLSFLSAQGNLYLWSIISGSFLGMCLIDLFWFAVPRSSWFGRFKNWRRVSEKYKIVEEKIENFSHGSDIIVLFISKVIFGVRILALNYLSIRKLSYSRFMIYNSAVNLVWSIVLGMVGYFAGKGYYDIVEAYDHITYGALYVVGIIVVIYSFFWVIKKWIIR